MPFVAAVPFVVALALTSAVVLVFIAIAVISVAAGILVPALPTLGVGLTVLRVGALPVITVPQVVLSSLGVAHLRLFPRQSLCSLRGTFSVVVSGLGVVGLAGQQLVGSKPVERVMLVVSGVEEAGVCVVEHVRGVAVL